MSGMDSATPPRPRNGGLSLRSSARWLRPQPPPAAGPAQQIVEYGGGSAPLTGPPPFSRPNSEANCRCEQTPKVGTEDDPG